VTVEDLADAMRRRNAPTGDWRDRLAKTEDGTRRKNMYNACVALREHPDVTGRLAYDEFNGCPYVRGRMPWDARSNRPWTQFDDLAATDWLQSPTVGVLVGSNIVREALERVAYENRFHPILEYLENLEWDGKERLTGWLTTYLGVPNTPLSAAIGRKFLVSAVARVMRPGCKVDHLPILEGAQGTLKSTALRTLVGEDWFADQIADLGTKDSCQDLRGKWLIELSELSAIRPGEVERVKAYATRQVDHYRASYGRRSGDIPRQTVFAGTTNAHEYLSDTTGGRRFWPLACTRIDVDAIARDRDQLWAEATQAYHANEFWWLDDQALRKAVRQEQELRRVADPWEAIIADWLENPTKLESHGVRIPLELKNGQVTTLMLLEHAISMPSDRQNISAQMRVGKILKLFGWTKRKAGKANRVVWELGKTPQTTESDDSADTARADGVSPHDVSRQGVSPETQAVGHEADGRDTADTFSRTCVMGPDPGDSCTNHEKGLRGVSGVSPALRRRAHGHRTVHGSTPEALTEDWAEFDAWIIGAHV
jgi:predicted P-loop ATPase